MFSSKQISTTDSIDSEFANSMEKCYSIRKMKYQDIDRCLQIWRQVELTEAHASVASTLSFDPDAFYVAQIDLTGLVVGMCSCVVVRKDTAFIGFYAVDPKYQRLGIGRELWAKTLARFDKIDFNLGLYAVPSMSHKYQKIGFNLTDTIEMCVLERECKNKESIEVIKATHIDCCLQKNLYTVTVIDEASPKGLIETIGKYDDELTGQQRQKLHGMYLKQFESSSLIDENNYKRPTTIVVTKTIVDNEVPVIVAYGCLRDDNTNGATLGPIYANSNELCSLIVAKLLNNYELKPKALLSSMTLTCTPYARNLLVEKYGFKEMERCARLFTKYIPEADLEKIFCVHSPNFSLF